MASISSSLVPALVNPAAGNVQGTLEMLRADPRVDLHEISPDAFEGAISSALDRGATTIVVAGGDGTVATAASCVVNRPASLCVMRAGTLNHFARRLEVPADPKEALELAFTGTTRKVDVGWLNDQLFLNTSVVGLYVDYVRRRERFKERLGHVPASAAAAFGSFFTLSDHHVELESDGTRRTYKSVLFFVGVGERDFQMPVLGRMKPDGRRGLHVVAVQPGSRARLLLTVVRMATRGLPAWPADHHPDSFVVDSFRLHLRHSRELVALDGEIVDMPTPLSFRIQKDALTVRSKV